MSTRAYHLTELQIAHSPDDPRHVMPTIRADHRRVLDVGGGAGQTLIASELAPEVQAIVIDVDFEALLLGTELTSGIAFVNGQVEHLPFADGFFDLAIARVVLPLTFIPLAIGELGRVLRPGGDIWMSLHSVSRTIRNLASSVTRFQPKHALYRSYVLGNGALFHISGKLIPSPTTGRYESFQTDSSISRELRLAGFDQITAQHGRHYIVTATKQ